MHIKNLREAIEEDPKEPEFIRTIKGYGYTIQLDEPEDAMSKPRKARLKHA